MDDPVLEEIKRRLVDSDITPHDLRTALEIIKAVTEGTDE